MSRNRLISGTFVDPWHNLAAEELLFACAAGCRTLYIWQNANTVVIGRNQNAWKECRVALMESEGGKLARRTSGGGAVYHDLGNLNFTFLLPRGEYDLARQTGVVLEAVRSLGVNASFTGRNDLVTSEGAKFSGNAFRHSKEASLHHGTLLVNADMEKLGRYLAPSPEKLRAKGVESVRARVCNLADAGRSVTVSALRLALAEAFRREYGPYDPFGEEIFEASALAPLYEKHAGWEWRMGASPAFDLEKSVRFPWGSLELALTLENGRVKEARVYSDAMDEAFIRRVGPALAGAELAGGALAKRVAALGGECALDAAAWLEKQIF